ncbi:patatin-like phospholipase family protein [Parathalassolituus penaei]|uniref:Patatin-like phospholipase family protein n=1 Tax=Parathalassolituus penaei TaxID=2997323 RepID=A0A9X3EE22_9GAMM|nr:patatin-like phospholipase family protein [Parathalassolituus penaei]MCY0965849.1 patatin-like phospholipase family protein [Parathalassolituus penaei]
MDSGKSAGVNKTVALALGSGGARGYAHIGVLDALEERGYRVAAISGASMGAIIGGFYCAGKLQEFRSWACTLGYLDVLRLIDVTLLSSGVIRGDRVFALLSEFLGSVQIEDLPIPFTAVATDLTARKEIWFQSGSLDTAMRASAAIPSVLKPVHHNGHVLVDGGVLNPLPISPCVSVHADLIMAVDLNADIAMPDDFALGSEQEEREEKQAWLESIFAKAGSWFDKADSKRIATNTARQIDENIGKFEIMNNMLETMQLSLTRFKTAAYPPDLMINLPMTSCEMYEFYRASEMIALGYHIANKALDAYESGGASLYGQRMG